MCSSVVFGVRTLVHLQPSNPHALCVALGCFQSDTVTPYPTPYPLKLSQFAHTHEGKSHFAAISTSLELPHVGMNRKAKRKWEKGMETMSRQQTHA
jgi:hypothetical protein